MIYDKDLTREQKEAAQEVAEKLGLKGLRVVPLKNSNDLRFIQDRRTVTVVWPLIAQRKWADLRHLFRAVLDSSPVVMTRTLPTEWDS